MPRNTIAQIIARGLNQADITELEPGSINTQFFPTYYRVKVRTPRIKVESKTIGNAFILGHSSNAVLGSSALGAGTMGSWTEIETLYDIQELPTYGKELIVDFLNKEGSGNVNVGYPNYIIVGGSDTAFNTGQTRLINEIGITDVSTGDKTNAKKFILQGEFKSTDYYATEKFPITTGLVSWWRMNETVGTNIKDEWGSNTGTSANDASTMTITGKVGNALDFDDTADDFIDCGTDSSLTGDIISFGGWIKHTSNARMVPFGKFFTDYDLYLEGDTGGGVLFFGDGTNYTSISLSNLDKTNDGEWQHIFAVIDKSTGSCQVYQNGIEKINSTGTARSGGTPTTPFIIGHRAVDNNEWIGAIDEVAIFNRALSAEQVLELYDSSVLAYAQTIKEVGVVAGGRTKHTIDTTKGGSKVDITINTET